MGYEANFDPDLERRYACPVCLVALEDPVQTKCGHRFCRVCLARSTRSLRYAKCPVDNTWFDTGRDVFPDLAIAREVLSLFVSCEHITDDCDWRGELRKLSAHTRVCPHASVVCSNECGIKCKRRDLDGHLLECPKRLEPCQHCQENIVVADLTKHQLLVCPKFPVSCSVCGETSILRENIAGHVDLRTGDCPLVVVKCNYEYMGCYFQDRRKNMRKHDQNAGNHHLLLLSMKLAQQEEFIKHQNKEIQQLTSACRHLTAVVKQHDGTLQRHTRILDDLETDVSEHMSAGCNGKLLWKVSFHGISDTTTSPPFFTGRPGYRFRLVFEVDGYREDDTRYSSVYLCLEGSHTDQLVKFPVDATCYIKLLDQSVDVPSRHHLESSVKCRQLPRPAGGSTIQRGIQKWVETDVLLSGGYVKDDTIFISAEIKLNL